MPDLKHKNNSLIAKTVSTNKTINQQALRLSSRSSANIFFTQAVHDLEQRIRHSEWKGHRVQRFEHPIPSTDLLEWLQINTSASQYFWQNRKGTMAIAGLDAASFVHTSTPADLDLLLDQAKHKIAGHNCHFLLCMGFNQTGMRGVWRQYPLVQLVLPLIEASRHYQNYKLAINLCASSAPLFEKQKQQALALLDNLRFSKSNSGNNIHPIRERTDKPSRDQWPVIVNKALQEIRSGRIDKIVLTRHVELELDDTIAAAGLLKRWQTQNRNCFSFLFKNSDSCFFGCSPERLFLRHDRALSTEALAGTVDRGACAEEDFFNEQQLRCDPKLRREHQLVVDFLQQNLECIANNIETVEEAVVFKLARIQHLYFPLSASLHKGIDDAQIMERLHPTPAICGTPKSEAMQLIGELERSPRGLFSGLVGVVSPKETEMCVSIRSALLQGTTLHCYSGVGIIEGSEENLEWAELEAKISTLLEFFSG